uniref:FBD domain-containing protein n=1 Tax=Tetradesmus obliquus TaxID=3088 RepID=A0A383WJ49_TETOB|eukprot:jgi/Sobl393_1/1358/SZX59831.1
MLLELPQLTRLSFTAQYGSKKPLLRLSKLTALQELQLHYSAANAAADTAQVWRQLPQLQALSVEYECHTATAWQLQAIAAGAAAATRLTKLHFRGESFHDEEFTRYSRRYNSSSSEDEDEGGYVYFPGSLCRQLAGLRQLRDLSIITGLTAAGMPDGNWLWAEEVSALTVLTGLTRLVLVKRDGWFDRGSSTSDTEVLLCRLCKLAQLRELELESCDKYSRQSIVAIGHMEQLTRLRLAGEKQWPDFESQKDLLQLAWLSKLQRLELCSSKEVAGGVMRHLRAKLPDARVRWCKWVDEFKRQQGQQFETVKVRFVRDAETGIFTKVMA